MQSALTGHLVLSTLHTNTAAGAITRLEDMGVERYLITSAVSGVLAQRLVRTLCDHCKTPVELDAADLRQTGLDAFVGEDSLTIYQAAGCEACMHSGYAGRTGIHELFVLDDDMHRVIMEGADATGLHRVAYAEVSAADRAALDGYLRLLGQTPVSQLSRAEQLPFWINLYNALTIDVVLDHYPVDSIRDIDISPGLFSDGPWGKKLIEVEGEAVSLDDIEHRILRPIWRDPRVHYAVNCASLGCPNLALEPYLGATIDAQLDAAARDFVNSGRAVQFEGMDLVVSSIYDWFQEDFGSSDQDAIDHLMTYAEPNLDMTLEGFSTIDDDRYDWALNDASSS